MYASGELGCRVQKVRCLQDQKIDLVIRIKPDIEEHENKYRSSRVSNL